MRCRSTGELGGQRGARRSLLLVLLALLFVTASACGGEDSGDDSADFNTDAAPITAAAAPASAEAAADSAAAPAVTAAPSAVAAAGDSDSAAAALAAPTVSSPADLGRDIVYRATISVEAADVAAATREAAAIVQGLGGIVFGQQTRTTPQPRSETIFKVLPEDFSLALERLAGVGELVDQQISADDVTERVVNFESRIATAEASVLRLRKFLEEAANIDNVALIERELMNRETDLETLRGQLRTLKDQVNLATITLTIYQLPDPLAVIPETGMTVEAWVSAGGEDPCLGVWNIDVERDDTVHFCLQIENTGEVALSGMRVRSEALRLRSDAPSPNTNSFALVQGNFERLEPGQLLIATLSEDVVNGRLAGRTARRLEVSFDVTVTPVDSGGAELDDIYGTYPVSVSVAEEDMLFSFPAAVRAGFGALVFAGRVLAVVVGVLVPFLPVIALVVAAVWWISRRIRRTPWWTAEASDDAPEKELT